MVRAIRLALVAALLAAPLPARAECRLALALGLDVSASVDALEYQLQIDGLVYALNTATVRSALLALERSHVDLFIYEWSGLEDQHVLLDWMSVRSQADIEAIKQTLKGVSRSARSPGTAIGAAIAMGHNALKTRNCRAYTLDISGDGKSNQGGSPRVSRDRMADEGMTINALVIGADASHDSDIWAAEIGALQRYYETLVITGPDAFVQTALGYAQYGEAMARKLERELGVVMTSQLTEAQQ